MSSQVEVRFVLPAPALRSAVSTYYLLRIQGDEAVEDLLHPEWPNVRLLVRGGWSLDFWDGSRASNAAPAALVSGVLTRTAVARGEPGLLVGVGLLPAGWAMLTGRPAAPFVDALHRLANFTGPSADRLVEHLAQLGSDDEICRALDLWFDAQFARRPAPDPSLAKAQHELMDPALASVAEWAQRIGRSTRQLERLALDHFGMTPKRLLRRQRFLRTFAEIREMPLGSWGRLIDERYADQSHFVRDFQHFMGLSPRRYFARDFPFMRAAGDARKALLGSPVQGLHRG